MLKRNMIKLSKRWVGEPPTQICSVLYEELCILIPIYWKELTMKNQNMNEQAMDVMKNTNHAEERIDGDNVTIIETDEFCTMTELIPEVT